MAFVTRFAPSPTGPLHLGHAYSALLAHDMARAAGGTFLLRIEDIDTTRCRPEWEEQIYDDLAWLGIRWDDTPMRQSDRIAAYDTALQNLWDRGLLYPCACTRRDITAAASAPQEGSAPAIGPDGPIYPGTCRPETAPTEHPMPVGKALRLNMAVALRDLAGLGAGFGFDETGDGVDDPPRKIRFSPHEVMTGIGDIVLSRRDFPGSYHLSVVLDDRDQGITHVIRGQDLFDATRIHVVLQRLIGMPTPIYHHHRLIRDGAGKRLAKRDDARAISKYRSDGASPADIRALVGL